MCVGDALQVVNTILVVSRAAVLTECRRRAFFVASLLGIALLFGSNVVTTVTAILVHVREVSSARRSIELKPSAVCGHRLVGETKCKHS